MAPKKKPAKKPPVATKPRDQACTPRPASRLELYGGEKRRANLDVGDRADVCVDGHGYHWVLVTEIELDYERARAVAVPVGPVATPAAATSGSPAVQRIAQRLALAKAEKEARLAARKGAVIENKRRAMELSARVYHGLLTNDPAPACLGCQLGRKFTFRHESVKEVQRGGRGVTVAQAIRNLRNFIADMAEKPRLSADHEAISRELGVVRPLTPSDEDASDLWVEEDYFADEAPSS